MRWLATRGGADLSPDDLRLLCHLRRPPAYRILGELLVHHELPQHAFVAALGLAKASVSHHLKELAADAVVVARASGRERRYRLVAPAQVGRLIRQFDPIPHDLDTFAGVLQDLLRADLCNQAYR